MTRETRRMTFLITFTRREQPLESGTDPLGSPLLNEFELPNVVALSGPSCIGKDVLDPNDSSLQTLAEKGI